MIRSQPFPASVPASAHRGRARLDSKLRRVQRLQGAPVARRILGVDPGLHRTGYGIIELDAAQSSHVVEAGLLKASAADTLPQRLQTLYDGLKEVLDEHAPDVVVVEDLFSTYAHPRAALLMAQARGALLLCAQQSGAHVHSFSPNEVKQVVAGNGHASKAAVQSAVKNRLHLVSAPNPSDVADALALALCYAARQGWSRG